MKMMGKGKCQGNPKHYDKVSSSDESACEDEMRLREVFDVLLIVIERLRWRREFRGQW